MKFRAVLAGCGAMARGWVRALKETPGLKGQVELVGLVDLDLGAAKKLATEFGLNVATGTNLAAMLDVTKPDLVFDVVIPAARRDVVATALGKGCHVLSEKPMAASMDEAREMLRLAGEHGRVHAVVQNRRFISGVRRIRRMIEEGTLGDLTALHADFFIGAHFGGFREQMQNILLLDMAIHTFDAARFMSGKTPLAVYCHETNPRASWYAHGAAANAIFEFSDDVTFTYRGSWVAEGGTTSWESAWRFIGTKGTLIWDGGDSFVAKTATSGQGLVWPATDVAVPLPHDESQTHDHASVIAEFLAAIEAGRAPETASNDNIKSLGMVFGAIESARTRSRVEISA